MQSGWARGFGFWAGGRLEVGIQFSLGSGHASVVLLSLAVEIMTIKTEAERTVNLAGGAQFANHNPARV